MPRSNTIRVEFSKEHDSYLIKYLAKYCPSKEGRSGQKVFRRLVANEENRWPWSVRHPWQSWRDRYVKNSGKFDAFILDYQTKHNIKQVEKRKRASEPMPIEMLRPSVKRVKLEAEESTSSSETHVKQDIVAQNASSGSTESKSTLQRPPEPHEPLSQVHPSRTLEPPHLPASSSPHSTTDTSTGGTKSSLDLPALQTRHDTLEIPSPSHPPAPPPTDGNAEPSGPPRAVKRVKERPRAPSEVFASDPSSPTSPTAVVDVPVSSTVYPRAPPRVVNSLHGQVLVDRKGHVPRPLLRGMKGGVDDEEEEVVVEVVEHKAQWPPTRGRTARQGAASGSAVESDKHHAFSQSQPHPRPQGLGENAEMGEREQGMPPLPDRRAVAAQFSAGICRSTVQMQRDEREDVRNGDSPVRRVVPTAPKEPAPDRLSGHIAKPLFKVSRFPAPRASTQSPFRPELPVGKVHRAPPQPQARPQSRTKAARHPALARIRRQTIGHGNGSRNGHDLEHRRDHVLVPSVDLVALSNSSTSVRSHSHSSTGTSAPTRPSRWSLPIAVRATPWVSDEHDTVPSAPGSVFGSSSGSPFRWVAPAPAYGDLFGHRRQPSSRVGTSTPRFTFTPSPAHSTTNGAAPHPNAISISPSLSLSLTPHAPDASLTASHGLASILTHMPANHGLGLGVVEAVYARVGSLREADEVLRGMREAAERFGEREIERRVRGRREARRSGKGEKAQGSKNGKEWARTQLSYVVASEDGDGSEYSPPETSRAAMWIRQSESTSYAEEEEGGVKGDRDDEEEEEGRAVEQELQPESEYEDGDGDELPDTYHDFSGRVRMAEGNDENDSAQDAPRFKDHAWDEQAVKEALLENMKAQELERVMGKGRFRKDIVRRFG